MRRRLLRHKVNDLEEVCKQNSDTLSRIISILEKMSDHEDALSEANLMFIQELEQLKKTVHFSTN